MTVTNTGAITTEHLISNGTTVLGGNRSHGIIAQSVRGGGGSAATTVAATPAATWRAGVTVGGTGTDGGDAGREVTNSARITGVGNGAAGLVARSIGGGGGDSQATAVSVSGTG